MKRCVVHRAFTVIELLIVVGVIVGLVSLLVPAVQYAREAARQTQCRNNLRQLGVAMIMHHDAQKHFPTGGWGHAWVGDPNYGFREEQPGGWVFNVLPFMEQETLRQKGIVPISSRRQALKEMIATPVPLLNCPTRRSFESSKYLSRTQLRNTDLPSTVAKSDYAVNGGSLSINSGQGPRSHSVTDIQIYVWPSLNNFNGVSFVRSRIRIANITDGTSNTYLVGEKYISFSDPTGSGGDDQTMFLGDDADIRRWGSEVPLRDRARKDNRIAFGSMHADGCGFVMVDGSVRFVSYFIDQRTHSLLSDRRDGQAVILPE